MQLQRLSLNGKTGGRLAAAFVMALTAAPAGFAAGVPAEATVDRAGEVDFDAAMAAFNEAMEAQKAGDAFAYRHGLERAAARLADPARLLYRLAGARLAAGDRAGALAALALQVDAGFVRDPRGDEAFAALAGDPEFLTLMARTDALGEPIVASTELFRIAERGALFEGIARHPFNESFFFSSVHRRKVVQRLADGTVRDFVAPGAHGLAAALGLAVDAPRKLLWIVSAGLPQAAGLPAELRDRSALLAVDLDSGELRRKVEAPGEGRRWWNDVVVTAGGVVYVSDGGAAAVARIDLDGAVTTLVEGHGLRSPGGLALSADERTLYVADWSQGLAAVDVATGALTWMRPPAATTVLGIDGLRRVGDALIAIQNGVTPHRIQRLTLAPDGRSLTAAATLERAVPGWDEPTLGIVVDDAMIYVANSQWPKFGEDGATPDPTTLTDLVVRRLPLR
jgi:sugar lactone lactonase YvrE